VYIDLIVNIKGRDFISVTEHILKYERLNMSTYLIVQRPTEQNRNCTQFFLLRILFTIHLHIIIFCMYYYYHFINYF
jgi:hypothetical protein